MITLKNAVARLFKYKDALKKFKTLGFVRIFSENLADSIGVASSQVRKDFSMFGITGNKRGGYNIDDLLGELNRLLGKDKVNEIIVAGTGHIGSALMNYKGFEKENIRIAAGFDIDPQKLSESAEVPVYPLENMKEFIQKRGIRIGIIAVPDIAGQQILDLMVSAGIKGVINFAPIRLRSPKDVIVHDVHLSNEVEMVAYFVNTVEKDSGANDS